jgi:hypothetical protein
MKERDATLKLRRVLILSERPPTTNAAQYYEAPITHVSSASAGAAPSGHDAFVARNVPLDETSRGAVSRLMNELSGLRLLSVDDTIVSTIGPNAHPTLVSLHMVGTSRIDLTSWCLPALRTLMAEENKLLFSARRLPVLERLALMLGGKRMWRELLALGNLWALQVGPMDDAGLANLSALPLEILIARRGPLADLSALRCYPKLTEFGAILCQELRDLSPLADVPALTDLTLHDCAHLEEVDAILKLPNLQRAMIWGCRDPRGDLVRVVRTLRERGVDVRSELDA